MTKKTLFFIGIIIALYGCNSGVVTKPAKLIDEDEMVNIIYDLSLLEGVKSQNPYAPQNQAINPKTFIYKKYHIDSLQFAQSNHYYASQISLYKKMYEKVNDRIEFEKKKTDSLLKRENAVAPAPLKPAGGDVGQVK